MSIPPWDTNIPDKLLIQGYSESFQNNNLRSPVDVGPAKIRRRATAAIRPLQGNQLMTAAQIGYLKTFYYTTLLSGSLRFSWISPVDGGSVEMRFVEPPSWSNSGNGFFNVSLNLEILP